MYYIFVVILRERKGEGKIAEFQKAGGGVQR